MINNPRDTSQSICGTPQYLAPQMIRKEGHGFGVDWWSLGCLIYEMLRLFPPFRHENRLHLFEMILVKQPDLTKFSPALQDLMLKLLQKDPKKRLGNKSAQEIQSHPWFTNINWKLLYERKLKSFFIPNLVSGVDIRYFDQQFTKEPINSLQSSPNDSIIKGDDSFKDFQVFISEE